MFIVEGLESRQLLSAGLITLATFSQASGTNLLIDAQGNIFGTLSGTLTTDAGSIFEIPAGTTTPTTLASFGLPQTATNGNVLGEEPGGNLVTDPAGDFFGTADNGAGPDPSAHGTLWELPHGSSSIKVLGRFDATLGASGPGGLIRNSAGDLVGIAGVSSGPGIFEYPANGSGITLPLPQVAPKQLAFDPAGNLFVLDLNGVLTEYSPDLSTSQTLAAIGNQAAAFTVDSKDNVYITTALGGAFNAGQVLELPAGSTAPIVLASLDDHLTGSSPGPILLDSKGDVFVMAGAGDQPGIVVDEIPAGDNVPVPLANFSTGGTLSGFDPAGNLIISSSVHGSSLAVLELPASAILPPGAPQAKMYHFGRVTPRKNAHLVLAQIGGGQVVFVLKGPGEGSVTIAGDGGYDVSLSNTSAATSVAIVPIGRAAVTAALDAIAVAQGDQLGVLSAPRMTFRGSFAWISGLKKLAMGNLTNAQISGEPDGPVSISLGNVVSSTLYLPGPPGTPTITVASMNQSTVWCAELTRLVCRGDLDNTRVAGIDFGPVIIGGNLLDSTFSVAAISPDPGLADAIRANTHALASLVVRGSILGSTQIAVAQYPEGQFDQVGSIGPITIGSLLSPNASIGAYTIPATVRVHGRRVPTAGNPVFHT